MHVWQADDSVKNCPFIAIPNQISIITLQKASLVKTNWHLLFIMWKWKYRCVVADKSVKNSWNLTISNPKQGLFKILMHISNLVKILWHLLVIIWKLKYGWTDGQQRNGQAYVQTHGHPTWNHNILSLSCGGGVGGWGCVYKKTIVWLI